MPKTKTSKSKKTKKSKSKKNPVPTEESNALENVETAAPVVNDVVESTSITLETSDKNVDTSTSSEDMTLMERIDHHQSVLQEIIKLLRTENKAITELRKLTKQETKKKKRKKSGGAKQSNSGIMRKFKLDNHPQLAKFMGSDIASRVDVLSAVSKYSKENNLQAEDNKKCIVLDKKLSKLFPELVGKDGDERLSYTSIMKHISKFFPKKGEDVYDEAIVEINTEGVVESNTSE